MNKARSLKKNSKASDISFTTSGLGKDLFPETMNEDLKRYFFSLVSSNKKALGERHLGYYVNTNKMFLYSTTKPIPVGEWPEFVAYEMSQRAEQWKDENQLRKIRMLLNNKVEQPEVM